jgi:hypothetical protein
MNAVLVFLAGVILAMGVVSLVLWYMRNPLLAVLTDLCGTVERARFWTTFSNITLFLVPFVLALDYRPGIDGNESGVFAVSDQIQSAVTGLIVSMFILGMVLSWHIAKGQPSSGYSEPPVQRESI